MTSYRDSVAIKIMLLILCLSWYCPVLVFAEAKGVSDPKIAEFIGHHKLAEEYYFGKQREQSYAEAVKWYSKVIEFEPGTDKNRLMSALYYKSIAYERLGIIFSQGLGVRKNPQQALKLYKRGLILYQQLGMYKGISSATANSTRQIKLEISKLEKSLNLKAGVKNNYVFDLNALKQQAQSGNLEAQNELGDYYYGTNYQFVNMTEAIKWYQKAAEKNHSSAIFSLGYIYELGKGVKVDKDKGESYFLRLGNKKQMPEIILAHLYETGRGREKNLDYALELYQKLPGEVATADVIRVQDKLASGTAVFANDIVYQNNPVRPVVELTEKIKDGADQIIKTHDKTMPFAAVFLVLGFIIAGVARKYFSKPDRKMNQTVSAAKILVGVGDYTAARDMLLDHLQDNPSDDRARELLQQTVRIH